MGTVRTCSGAGFEQHPVALLPAQSPSFPAGPDGVEAVVKGQGRAGRVQGALLVVLWKLKSCR